VGKNQLKRRQRGGQQIVDAVPPATSSPQQATVGQQVKGNKGKSSASGGKASTKSVAAVQPKTLSSVPQLPPKTSLVQVNVDVDETLPFSFPDVNQMQQAPPQPGVLPMWDEEGEDLLQ